MDRIRHLRNYGLHSWSGMVLGLFVYVVAFTGCLALFHHEMLSWEDPTKRLTVAESPVEIDRIFKSWVDQKIYEQPNSEPLEFIRFSYPDEHEPYFSAGATVKNQDGQSVFVEQRWDTRTGAPLAERGDGVGTWILDFHRDLMWPKALGGRTAGSTIVGIAGVVLMLSILTGVIAHTKIVQEFFTLRYFRSVRLKWQDTHKVLGLWGLPFYTMIAFTGAILGVVAILAPLVALLTFKGDQQGLIDEVLGKAMERSNISAPMMSVDTLADFTHPTSGKRPILVAMENWGDKNARFELFYLPETKLISVDQVEINGVTAEVIEDSPVSNLTPGTRGLGMMSPLHYGTYGGIWLKFLYFILGLSLAVITVFGLMMWIERRLHGNAGSKSERFYRNLGHMVTGVAVGLPLASISIFWLDKLYVGTESARLFWTGSTYFIVWALVLVFAFVRKQDYRTTRDIILLTGILMVGLPVLNALMTGDTVFELLGTGHKPAAWVDLTFLVSGLVTIAVAAKLPRARSETAKQKRIVTSKADESALVTKMEPAE